MDDTTSRDPAEPSGRLYFKQLLAGRDFGQSAPFAAQMANFVYAIGDRETGETLLVDPAWAVRELVELVEADGMRVSGALVTHYHPDHCGGDLMGLHVDGLATLMEVAPCKVHVHQAEAVGVQKVSGVDAADIVGHASGDRVQVGAVEVELLHTPGHTPGSCCFRLEGGLVAGDTLFLQGCGRVDLPGGDADALFHSLARLKALPASTVLYPGHAYGGASAEMGAVVQMNPYLGIDDLAVWQRAHGR